MIKTQPMRVLFVLNSLDAGGAEKQVLSLLQHMDRTRFQLALTYLRRREQLLPQVPALSIVHCCDSRKYVDLAAIKRLADLIDDFQPALVVCTNSWSLMNLSLARVWTTHTFATVEVFHTTALHTLKQRLQMQLYRRLFEQCDALIYVCENQRRYWRDQGIQPRCDHVIYNGVDLTHFHAAGWDDARATVRQKYGFEEGDFVIGLCAGLRPEKAHGDLLQIVQRLRAQGLPVRALLIGEGGQRAAIETRIRELALTEHVRITGFQVDVRPFISACDVMTLVSHSIETFSIAALEAMAMGKPMVMTRVGGADEQIREGVTGYLFSPGDLQIAATHFTALLDAERRTQMGRAAAEAVRDSFSLERMVRAYEDFFSSIGGAGRLHRAA